MHHLFLALCVLCLHFYRERTWWMFQNGVTQLPSYSTGYYNLYNMVIMYTTWTYSCTYVTTQQLILMLLLHYHHLVLSGDGVTLKHILLSPRLDTTRPHPNLLWGWGLGTCTRLINDTIGKLYYMYVFIYITTQQNILQHCLMSGILHIHQLSPSCLVMEWLLNTTSYH